MEIVEREFGKANLSLETGRLARQANGSVLVRYGDTMVLVAATASPGSGAVSYTHLTLPTVLLV